MSDPSDASDASGFSDSDFVIVDEANTSSEISKLSTWLQPTAYRHEASEFHKHLSAHVPGTGDWVEETPEYHQWHDAGSHGVLWIKAIAGGGKSVLTASRIAHLQRNEPQATVLFFFFRQIVTANHESHALVRDWLDQLLPHSPSLQAVLKARLDADPRRSATEMAFTELWQILVDDLLVMPTPVYCIADALDELDAGDVNDLLPRLIDLGTQKPKLIRVLVSSRPLPQIQKIFGGVSTVIPLRLENPLVNRDIACFVEYQLNQARDLQEEVRDKIKNFIEDHSFPSFLYARLMLDELLEEPKRATLDIQSVQQAMLSIPTSLEDLYSHMLNDHSLRAGVPRERQMLILQLVTHATRPLRLLEIATVLEFLDTKDNMSKHENSKNLTRMSCGPLLEILPDETVSVIHHSFTEFLLDASRADATKMNNEGFPAINAAETNHLMALICVRYLLSGGLTTWKRPKASRIRHDPWKDLQLAQLEFPFVEYAACNWYIHVSRLPEISGELLELLDTFTRPENPSYLAFVELVMKVERSSKPTVIPPLHVCAWGHMTSYAKELIQSGHDCNALDGSKMTPLARAASKGFPDMVFLLLEHGATPNPPEVDGNGRMPLHYAAQKNHHQVVKLLLEAGANPLIRRSSIYDPPTCVMGIDLKNRQSPLEYACQAGAVESIQAIFPYLNAKDLESALKCSIEARQLEIVKLLVDLPEIDMTAKELMKECLLLALKAKDPQILQFFLDMAAKSEYGPSAETLLLTFCESLGKGGLGRHESTNDAEICLDLILQTGCDVNARWETGRTPLHACIQALCPTLVEKLLKHGADVHATDRNGDTPLHVFGMQRVFFTASAPILGALMQYGAQWDVVNNDSKGLTPLLAFCSQSFVGRADIEMLQPYVKDWNVADKEGNTPIHLLLKGRADKKTLQKLVDLGADPNWRNNEGLAPLHRIQTIDQVHLLLSVGADLETRDYRGRTLLLRTMLDHDPSQNLSQLLKLGANLHATDYDGNGALHLLCEHRRQIKSLRILFDAGANPHHCNNRGDTLWHTFMRHALQWNYDSLITAVYLLRRAGIPLALRNHDGQTLLHCMCGAEVKNTKSLLNPQDNPIDHLPVTEVNAILEVEDRQGRRPIHLAASHSEALVAWLIRRGASLTGKTRQGENLLHIAAAARASNTIGLLLKSYKDDQQRKMAVNEADKDGCTPLHIACRSGRLESVELLLEAGAEVNAANKKKETPLHACAEFKRQPELSQNKITVCDDDDTLRVAEIISLLLAHNADPSAKSDQRQTPVELAITKQNTEMVILLADTYPLTPQCPRPNAGQLYLKAGDDYIDTLVSKLVIAPQITVYECEQLLKLGAYRVLERLGAQGVKMYEERKGIMRHRDFLDTLARWGFADLFEKLGRARGGDSTHWVNGNMSRPHNSHRDLLPFIFTAASRSLPSLNLLRVIVETFNADVNVRAYEEVYAQSLHDYMEQPHRSVLHILAAGEHWWQTEAIQYMLDHGADVTMRDAEGRTPLHIAITCGYCRLDIARTLLEHGADPNAFDRTGVTPLGFAAGNSEMVRLLLQHGGRVELGTKPILFEAITCQDVDTVRTIIESGFDFQQPFKTSLAELDAFEKPKRIPVRGRRMSDSEEPDWTERKRQQNLSFLLCTPLHYAARGRFNKVAERHKAVAIVELLLAHGADPFLSYGENSTVIHDVLTQGGIVEPLLALPNLELERRDGRGRTLLLAACEIAEEDSFRLAQKHDHLEPRPSGATQKIYAVDRLCEMGAEVSVVDEAGNNPLHFLVAPGEYKASARMRLPFLIGKCPALVHQRNQYSETPLHLAAKSHVWDTMQILLDASADAFTPDAEGNTVLHHIAGCLDAKDTQLWERFRRFLDQGLDINARNNNGETPLFVYIRSLSCTISLRGPVMDGLIASGSDVFVRNHEGESLLHIVAKLPCSSPYRSFCRGEENLAESFSYLMELGLNPLQEDKKQRTPMDVAAACGKDDILALFKK